MVLESTLVTDEAEEEKKSPAMESGGLFRFKPVKKPLE